MGLAGDGPRAGAGWHRRVRDSRGWPLPDRHPRVQLRRPRSARAPAVGRRRSVQVVDVVDPRRVVAGSPSEATVTPTAAAASTANTAITASPVTAEPRIAPATLAPTTPPRYR